MELTHCYATSANNDNQQQFEQFIKSPAVYQIKSHMNCSIISLKLRVKIDMADDHFYKSLSIHPLIGVDVFYVINPFGKSNSEMVLRKTKTM